MTDLVSLIKAAIETAPHRQMNGRIDYQSMAEAAAENLWQPIETAPKNGTTILAWADGFGLGPLVLYWSDGRWREVAQGLGLKIPPIRWMPIPKPPQT